MSTKTRWLAMWMVAAAGLPGCQGAIWGNLVALGITTALFVGTLQLGRGSRAPQPEVQPERIDSRRL